VIFSKHKKVCFTFSKTNSLANIRVRLFIFRIGHLFALVFGNYLIKKKQQTTNNCSIKQKLRNEGVLFDSVNSRIFSKKKLKNFPQYNSI